MNVDPDFPEHVYMRHEVVDVSGATRGMIDTWELAGYWKYTGPDTRHHLFNFADLLAFALVVRMIGAGISTSAAWWFVAQILDGARQFGAPLRGFLVLRRGAGVQDFTIRKDLPAVSNWLLRNEEWDVSIVIPLHRVVAELKARLVTA